MKQDIDDCVHFIENNEDRFKNVVHKDEEYMIGHIIEALKTLQEKPFDVLEHWRNGGSLHNPSSEDVFFYSGAIDQTLHHQHGDKILYDSHECFVDWLFDNALEPYIEPDTTEFLKDGQWYWVKLGSSEADPMKWDGTRWVGTGFTYQYDDVKPKLINGKPVLCVEQPVDGG